MWAAAGQQFLIAVLNPAQKSNLLIRIWRKMFTLFRMHFFINLIYGWLDEKDKNYVNTINYVIVAKK